MGFKGFMCGLCVGALTFGVGITYVASDFAKIKQAQITTDLNHDGVPDIIVEQVSGYKTPMYGIPVGDKLFYVPAREIKRIHPHFDYQRLEELLNEEEVF